eukprot:GHVP01070244.1.p1 GENE.GHVP01070244.1~~GHVP01070244.1.p1  ORF type:complete len:417 (+),score=58.43 GHVP01070244.1:286-1536(+)
MQYVESILEEDVLDDIEDIAAWEEGYNKTWEKVREGEDGLLVIDENDEDRIYSGNNKSPDVSCFALKGVIRNMVLCFDFSSAMIDIDYKPDRVTCAMHLAKQFIIQFFSSNPISQLALIAVQDGSTYVLCNFSSSPQDIVAALDQFKLNNGCKGFISLYNVVDRIRKLFNTAMSNGTKEVLFINGSLRTCDPSGDIEGSIKDLGRSGVVCFVVSLAPQMRIIQFLCEHTNGWLKVPLDKESFECAVMSVLLPPPLARTSNPGICVKMAFPTLIKRTTVSLCLCHSRPGFKAFVCPKCLAQCCSIPCKCPACGIHLISPTDLTRTAPFVSSVPPFNVIEIDQITDPQTEPPACEGCHYILAPRFEYLQSIVFFMLQLIYFLYRYWFFNFIKGGVDFLSDLSNALFVMKNTATLARPQ